LRETIVPLAARDGHPLQVIHLEGERKPWRGPVLLVHGAGVRANMFRPPVERSVVDVLLEAGFDVWLENWRASVDFPYNSWTLDQGAVLDHPVAVRAVLDETGSDELSAVIHCQGSCSFALSVVAGLVPQVTKVVTNSVTLHPVVPPRSALKLRLSAAALKHLTPYVDPTWGIRPDGALSRALVFGVNLSHRECANAVCKMTSFCYGIGRPAMWSHDLLNDVTHDWLAREWGPCPITFYRQMARSVVRQELVLSDGFPELPADLLRRPPQTDARFLLLSGTANRCFLPESQYRTLAYLEAAHPGRHRLVELPGYGHLDVFFGRDSARDVFPLIVDELSR
jgi:hypothetical protein